MLPVGAKLYCLTSIFNPHRYQSRYRLYKEFVERVKAQPNCELFTVEVAFGDRPHQVTEYGNPNHLQLRTSSELWLKEKALNLLFERLPYNWEYAAWIDADVNFTRPDWAAETIHMLQHWKILQMFNQYYDLAPDNSIYQKGYGFIYAYRNNIKVHQKDANDEYSYTYGGHPGFAWAIRRDAFDETGGLIDTAILGSADRHMALSLIGKAEESYNKDVCLGYKEPILNFQEYCKEHILEKFGYVDTGLLHYFHGKKINRQYGSRWKILVDSQFDPEFDVKRDYQGLWQLTDRNPQLKVMLHNYFKARNEDDISM